MLSCCKFYNDILVYTKGKEFLDISNDFIFTRPSLQNNGKGKGHPGTGHEGPERE
jgi:hypothetical protein